MSLLRARAAIAAFAAIALFAWAPALLPAWSADAPLPARAADAPRGADGLLQVPPLARVTDLAGALSASDRAAIDAKLAGFELSHGAQVAVVVVPSTKPEPIEDYAHRIGDAWKIGRKAQGDGVLVVVAIDDRRARIDVARALEDRIPDVVASRLIREAMAPRFAAKDYAGGLQATLDGIFERITGAPVPAGDAEENPPASAQEPAASGGEDAISRMLPIVIGALVVGGALRRMFGVPGALVASIGAGAIAGWFLASALIGAVVGVVSLVMLLLSGVMPVGRAIGSGPVFLPGGFGRGGGGGGGGFSSGGGGDFSGGGASGSW